MPYRFYQERVKMSNVLVGRFGSYEHIEPRRENLYPSGRHLSMAAPEDSLRVPLSASIALRSNSNASRACANDSFQASTSHVNKPNLRASDTAWVRLPTASLEFTLRRCTLTVFSEMKSRSPMSLLL